MGCVQSCTGQSKSQSRPQSSTSDGFDKGDAAQAALQARLAARLAGANYKSGHSGRKSAAPAHTPSLSDLFTPMPSGTKGRVATSSPSAAGTIFSPKLVTTKADLRRTSSMFVTRSRNVLLLFPVIPDPLPNCLRGSKSTFHSKLRVCAGSSSKQGLRPSQQDRVAVVASGLKLNPVCVETATSQHIDQLSLVPPPPAAAVLTRRSSDASCGEAKQNSSLLPRLVSGAHGGNDTERDELNPTPCMQLAHEGGGDEGGRDASTSVGVGVGEEGHEFYFAGVYDGHGGDRASEFLRRHLHEAVARRLCAGGNHAAQVTQAFLDVDAEICRHPDLGQCGSCAVVACVLPRAAVSPRHAPVEEEEEEGVELVGSGAGLASQALGGRVEEAVVCPVAQGDTSPASNPRAPSPARMSQLTHLELPRPAVNPLSANPRLPTPPQQHVAVGAGSPPPSAMVADRNANPGRVEGVGQTPDRQGSAGAGATQDWVAFPHTGVLRPPYPVQHSVTDGARGPPHGLLATPLRNRSMARLLIAHVGDSSAVLCRAGTAEAVCRPHKPNSEAERARIEAAGGLIAGNGRIHGLLDTSRAFGDVGLKANFEASGNQLHNGNVVVATPDVMEFDLLPTDEFLILASDGLLSVMNMQQAVNFVKKQLLSHGDVERAAEALANEAIVTQHSTDNVSVVIMAFHQSGSPRQGDNATAS